MMNGFMLCVVHTYGIFRIFDDWSLDFYLESDLLNPSLKLTSHTQVNHVCQQRTMLLHTIILLYIPPPTPTVGSGYGLLADG